MINSKGRRRVVTTAMPGGRPPRRARRRPRPGHRRVTSRPGRAGRRRRGPASPGRRAPAMPWLPSTSSSRATTRSIGTSGRPCAAGSSPTCTCRPRGRRLQHRVDAGRRRSRARRATGARRRRSARAPRRHVATAAPVDVLGARATRASSSAPGDTSTATTRAPAATAIMHRRQPDAAAAVHGDPLPGRTRPRPAPPRGRPWRSGSRGSRPSRSRSSSGSAHQVDVGRVAARRARRTSPSA